MTRSETPQDYPFESATELKEAHNRLLESLDSLQVSAGSAGSVEAGLFDLESEIRTFLRRGAATGVFLDEVKNRTASQVVLDYWVSKLSRAHLQVRRAKLARFEAERLPDLKDKPCPYVGLDAFRDGTFFFGREADTQMLVEQVKRSRLLVVTGASGSGKSSLVMGGVIPALEEAAEGWRIAPPCTPGNAPLYNLASSLLPIIDSEQVKREDVVAGMRANPNCLADLLDTSDERPVLVIIDQFEELFTLSTLPDRDALTANLAALLQSRSADRVILTVREEFSDRMAGLTALESFLDQAWYPMRPMGYDQLRAAVEQPAALVNLQFQSGIVDDLVKQVLGQPAALPLLQFTLRELWKKRDRNRVTWEVYRSVGDPLTALKTTADGFYSGLAQQSSDEMKRILLRLVRVDKLLEAYRQPVEKRELLEAGKANTEEVLKILNANGYIEITADASGVDELVEIKHEALIRNWPMLVGWIGEKRVEQQQRAALTQAAARWDNAGRPDEGLLTGWQLRAAVQREDLSDLERAFVDASASEVDRAQHEKEAALRREAEQSQKLASKERRLRWMTTWLLLAVVMIGVGLGTIWLMSRRAQTSDREATEQAWRAFQQEHKAADLAEALSRQEACERGDAKGCMLLGEVYEQGRGVAKDEERAAELYEQACDQRNAEGCKLLGRLYERGLGVLPKDEELAAKFYQRAEKISRRTCEGGVAEGCRLLGRIYEQRGRVAEDEEEGTMLYTKAREFYQQACDGGDAEGCRLLGRLYRDGRGVDPDKEEGARLYVEACETGSMDACASLGVYYRKGDGVEKDETKAAKFGEKACDGGIARGCFNLGYLFERGSEVVRDEVRAARLYLEACAGGNRLSCRRLGNLYEKGRGVATDDVRAAKFYQEACDRGDALGCNNLGFLYEKGRGVTKDEERAAARYQEACDYGSATGCYHLGVLFEEGRGVRPDKARAKELYQKACDGKDEDGCGNLARLND